MREALRAEWTKLRTLAGNLWLLAGVVVGTAAVGATVLATRSDHPGQGTDLTRLSLTGVEAGQALVVILAVGAIGGEYATGMIAETLTALPRRLTVLAAKAVTLAGVTAAGGAVAVALSLAAGQLVLGPHCHETVAGHSHALLSLARGSAGRSAVGSVLYLVLIAVLSLGIATAVRDSATAAGTVLGLLYLFPLVAQTVSDPAWQRHLQQVGPMTAGLSIQTTTHLSGQPIGPWAGLGVLCAWSAGALVLGAVVLRARDA